MSTEQRDLVEALVRDLDDADSAWDAAGGAAEDSPKVEAALTAAGFTAAQAREALQYARTFAAAVEWLCVHMPEDDLPPRYRPTTAAPFTYVPVGARSGRPARRHAAL